MLPDDVRECTFCGLPYTGLYCNCLDDAISVAEPLKAEVAAMEDDDVLDVARLHLLRSRAITAIMAFGYDGSEARRIWEMA